MKKSVTTVKRQKQPSGGRSVRAISIVLAVVIVLAVALGTDAIIASANDKIYRFSTVFRHKGIADTPIIYVNDVPLTTAEYDFFLYSTAHSFMQSLSQEEIDEIGLDDSKRLGEQPCYYNESISWLQYFVIETNEYLMNMLVMYDKALENGMTPDETVKSDIELRISQLEAYAEQSEVSLEVFIKALYSEYCDEASVRQAMEKTLMAQKYIDNYLKFGDFTEEEIMQFVEENSEAYFGANYNLMRFDPEHSDVADSVKEAKELAREFISKVSDRDSFSKLAIEYAAEEDKYLYEQLDRTYYSNATVYEVNNLAISDWLFDDDRKPGDTAVIYSYSTKAAYAVLFHDAYRNNSPTRNFRSLYLQVGKDGITNIAQALDAAEALVDEAKANGGTEQAFIDLVRKYSQYDYTDKDALFTNELPSSLTTELSSWLYSSERAIGDIGIVESSDNSGYYVNYYVGEGLPIWRMVAVADLADKSVDEYQAGLVDSASIKIRYEYWEWLDK